MNEEVLEAENQEDYFTEEWYINNADSIVSWEFYWEAIYDFSPDFFCQFNDEINMPKFITWLLQQQHTDTIKALFEAEDLNYDIDMRLSDNTTPLMWACAYCDLDTVNFFLDKGADINAVDENGVSVLIYSIRNEEEKLEIPQFLLREKVEVNNAQHLGQTPLMVAAFHGHVDLCDDMICHGADFNARCDDQASVLWYAEQTNSSSKEKLMSMLKNYGAILYVKNYNLI